MTRGAFLLAGLLAGAAGGFVLARALPSAHPAPRPEAAAPAAPVMARCTATLSVDDLALIRRDIAASAQPAPVPQAAAAAVAAEAPPPSPTQTAAAARASEIVDRALAVGRWTEDDANAFRKVSLELHPQDREQLVESIAMAVNAQRLQLATHVVF